MMRIGPNDKCPCSSGMKFKKCCGRRGGLTEIEYAEELAHREEAARERAKQPRRRGAGVPFLMYAAMMALPVAGGPGPLPPEPRKRNRRKPE